MTTEAAPSKPPEATRGSPKSFAMAVKSGLQLSQLLHIHLGQEERDYIAKDLFHKLMNKVEERIIADQTKEVSKLQSLYTWWARGKWLLGCQDEAMAEYLSRMISKIRMGGRCYKACPRGGAGKAGQTYLLHT